MVSRDSSGNVTSPVNFKTETVNGVERPVPDEQHVGSRRRGNEHDAAVQAGYARGGTTRPANGQSGGVQQLDNQGNVSNVHPGEIARITHDEGAKAAADKLGGGLPPGAPEPQDKSTSSRKKGS